MDSFFGIGLPELIVILLLAGIIMGPQRIRQVAYTLGRWTAQLQSISRAFARQLNAELDALEDDSVRDTVRDVRELQQEVETLRRELREGTRALRGQGERVINETKSVVDETRSIAEGGMVATPPAEDERPTLPNAIEVPGDPD